METLGSKWNQSNSICLNVQIGVELLLRLFGYSANVEHATSLQSIYTINAIISWIFRFTVSQNSWHFMPFDSIQSWRSNLDTFSAKTHNVRWFYVCQPILNMDLVNPSSNKWYCMDASQVNQCTDKFDINRMWIFAFWIQFDAPTITMQLISIHSDWGWQLNSERVCCVWYALHSNTTSS